MIWVFGIGYFTSAGIGIIAALRLLRILSGRMSDAEIAHFAGEIQPDEALGREGRI